MAEMDNELGRLALLWEDTMASFPPRADPVSVLQVKLMKEWARTNPTGGVSEHPASHTETFRDMAKVALTHAGIEWTEVNRGGEGK